jgi:methyl coenzyme M reductase gamma subunit
MINFFMDKTTSSYGDARRSTTQFPQVTHGMVRARTVELALIAGRSSIEIRQRDYEQAKRELTGESDSERQLAVLS